MSVKASEGILCWSLMWLMWLLVHISTVLVLSAACQSVQLQVFPRNSVISDWCWPNSENILQDKRCKQSPVVVKYNRLGSFSIVKLVKETMNLIIMAGWLVITEWESSFLTLSPPIPLRVYVLRYWSNPPFLISDIRALWRSGLSARAPECQKLKMVG